MRRETVVITGATAGVGRAAAAAFAGRGARIGLVARGRDRLEQARQEVAARGGEALALPTDVADAEQVEAAAQAVEDAFGGIDVWVNAAMTSVFAPVKDLTAEEYRRVTEVTYLGQVYGTMAALRRMLPRDHGSIVLVGSALAYRGIPLQSAYCGAKHGIQGFLDSLRTELIHDGSNVHVSMVQLPALNTPQFEWTRNKMPKKPQPVPPIYQPELAADAILWAADHEKREVHVGFPSVKAIVADKVAPGLLDRYLARKGYDGQMRDEDEVEDRPDNLWEPAPGKYGAHGAFDDRAKRWSLQWSMAKQKGRLFAVGVALIGLAAGLLVKRNGS